MRIELDTNSLSDNDKKILSFLVGNQETQTTTKEDTQEMERLAKTIRSIYEPQKQTTYPKVTYRQGEKVRGLQKTIRELFGKYPDNSYTAVEIAQRIGYPIEKVTTLQNALWNLKNARFLANSSERPQRYFIRARGDPELKDQIRPGTRVSVMR